MMTRTIEPALVARERKIRSAPNRWPLGRAPPPPEAGALAGVVVTGGAAIVDQARLLTDAATLPWSSVGSGAYPICPSLAWPSLLDVKVRKLLSRPTLSAGLPLLQVIS